MGKVLCHLLNPLHIQPSSVETSMIMLQDDLFLPWTFCHVVHNEALEHLEVLSSTAFLLCDKLNSYASFSIPEDSSHHNTGCGHCIWLIFIGWHSCDDFPCSVLLFLDQSVDTTVFVACSLFMTQGNNSSIISLLHTMRTWKKECKINYSHKLLTTCNAVP
jgi:hypothetical protein